MQQEVETVIKKLRALPKEFSKKKKRQILRKAAKPLIQTARNNIPTSDEPHYRYKTAKAASGIRAPKGEGNIVAVYHPGNLAASIGALVFRRSGDLFVGPRLQKRGAFGEFGKGKVDGYYAAFLEFGTKHISGVHYMRRAVPTATPAVQKIIIAESKKVIEDFAKKNKI